MKKNESDEIDLLAILKLFWLNKRLIIRISLIFLFVGLVIGILTSNQYTAKSSFIPQTSDKSSGSGGIGGLAALAGIDLAGMGNNGQIPPSLYPKIVSSISFKKALIKSPLKPTGFKNEISYAEYYEDHVKIGLLGIAKKYTIGLPGVILSGLKGVLTKNDNDKGVSGSEDLIRISETEFVHFERIGVQLSVVLDKRAGYVTLRFKMQDPVLAAQMAKNAESLLQKEIMRYKVQNAQEQLTFIEKRYNQKKVEFESMKVELAKFRDRNKNISSELIRSELLNLESEYSFAFNVYSELAKQLEQARFQVSKDTPIFTVIEPVTIPPRKSEPSRVMILFSYSLIGLILSIGFVAAKHFMLHVRTSWDRVNVEDV
ncbi:MAG: Wzz/FepE/Etk N-terminal domain-containing protein [Cyclobacteriaceae bacterium]